MCSENEGESIDALKCTSTVKNKRLVGNIPGCAVLFCGAWATFQKHVPLVFFKNVYKFTDGRFYCTEWNFAAI